MDNVVITLIRHRQVVNNKVNLQPIRIADTKKKALSKLYVDWLFVDVTHRMYYRPLNPCLHGVISTFILILMEFFYRA